MAKFRKKLTLNRETIRELTPRELRTLAGGDVIMATHWTCGNSCRPCPEMAPTDDDTNACDPGTFTCSQDLACTGTCSCYTCDAYTCGGPATCRIPCPTSLGHPC
jgi:natural product precursor